MRFGASLSLSLSPTPCPLPYFITSDSHQQPMMNTHFTDGETEAQRIVALGEIVPEVVQLVNYRAGQWDLEGQWFSVGLFLPGACAS